MRDLAFTLLLVSLAMPFAICDAQTLEGAIDLHAHAAPDGTPRKVDVLDLASAAKAAGMRAIVIKNHYEPTASLAYVVRKAVPGIDVFGGISLDLTVGGVNPAAVEWMTKVEGGYGKVVWLPTFDSEAQVKFSGDQRPFAPVTRDGKVLPEVLAVIALAAQHDLLLETGHSAPQESLLIVAEAKRRGVEHVLVTHAMASPGGSMTLDEMREAAKLGALLELVHSPLTDEQLRKEAEAIRADRRGLVRDFERSWTAAEPFAHGRPARDVPGTHGARHLGRGYRRHVAKEPGAAPGTAAVAR